MYMSKIVEVHNLFHGEGKSKTGSGQMSTEEKKRLIKMAKEKGIKVPGNLIAGAETEEEQKKRLRAMATARKKRLAQSLKK